MIYLVLFYEFFKIGLFAIGGGLVTVPFLFDLAESYSWFSTKDLADMIAVSESTPGPLGVNMATFAGFKTAGIGGGVVTTFGLVFPSLVIIILVSHLLKKFRDNATVNNVLCAIRPAVIALILAAGIEIAKFSFSSVVNVVVFVLFFLGIHFYRKSPIFYIVLAALIGMILKLA